MTRIARLIDLPIAELLVHDHDELVSNYLVSHGVWEAYETQLVLERLREGDTFVDIGANIGYYTCLASIGVGPSGRVIAFEPEPANFELLLQNIVCHGCRNVIAHRCAIGEQTGTASLFLSSDNLGDHRLGKDESRASIPVDVRRADDFLAAPAGFIKIDTQGAEVGVLRSLQQSFGMSAPHTMIVEFWPAALMRHGSTADELVDLLEPHGFEWFVIDHQNYELMPASPTDLRESAETTLHPDQEGFVNLLLQHNGA